MTSKKKLEEELVNRGASDVKNILAKDRTELANERTILAYIRTFLGCLGAGIACIKFLESDFFRVLGYIFLISSPIILVVGIWSYIRIRIRMDKYLL